MPYSIHARTIFVSIKRARRPITLQVSFIFQWNAWKWEWRGQIQSRLDSGHPQTAHSAERENIMDSRTRQKRDLHMRLGVHMHQHALMPNVLRTYLVLTKQHIGASLPFKRGLIWLIAE
jgi:hypothetical protein